MTSSQESSEERAAAGANCGPTMGIESLAGTFHPHAIEVQDFAYYALVIDVRPRAEYEDDHIPGAVHVEPPEAAAQGATADQAMRPSLNSANPASTPVWPALEAAVAGLRLDQAVLVYCGQGGLLSTPVARALRWRGWTTDVLPGGWINYRRWVQAGLEVLPRLVAFRVVACTLGSESARVLDALRRGGQQVLDLEALALRRRFAFAPVAASQPAQAWFDSLLLRELRNFDPRRPVWVGDVGAKLGSIALPGALCDALAIAPAAAFDAPIAARVAAWVADEPLCADPQALLQEVSALEPPPPQQLLGRWGALVAGGVAGVLLASILGEFLDGTYARDRATRSLRQHPLAPIVAVSLAPEPMLDAVAKQVVEPAAQEPPAT
jgi:tRNA 2-selenouridine synthase